MQNGLPENHPTRFCLSVPMGVGSLRVSSPGTLAAVFLPKKGQGRDQGKLQLPICSENKSHHLLSNSLEQACVVSFYVSPSHECVLRYVSACLETQGRQVILFVF